MKIDLQLLLNWDALWRYPALLTQVVSEDRNVQMSAAEVARNVFRGIAASFTLAESFNTLLEQGEFQAAAFLLSNLEKGKGLTESEITELSSRLAEVKARALAEIQIRKFELTTRAIRAGLEDKPLSFTAIDRSLKAAHSVLDGWEVEIYSKEVQLQNILAASFEHARSEISESDPHREIWEKSLAQSIDMCRFRRAEELLNVGPKAIVAKTLEPIQVPRRSVWPYTTSTEDVLRMITSGDNEIKRDWGPGPEDKSALQLLDSIKPLALADGEVRPNEVNDFVSSLDAWLGIPQREHPVISSDSGYTSVLYGLKEPRVPRLAMCEDGIPIWFPRGSARDIPVHVSDSPAVIAFYADREPTNTPKALIFTSTLLFRLAKDRHHRVNFIRWLARQIKTEDMMPATFDLLFLPKDDDRIRRYAAWLFDFHGIPVTSESVLELIVFYSASNNYLLRALISEIGSQIEDRDAGVKVEHVHKAWNNSKFRDSAIAHCLEPIAEDPWLLSILACAYFTAEAEDQVTPQDISDWLSIFGYTGKRDAAAGLRELTSYNLLAEAETAGSARIYRSAVGLLVREHVIDLEQYVTKQLQLLGEQT